WIGQAIVATRNSHTTEARALLEHSITLSAAIPEADLEFASRIFGLYVKGTLQAGDHDVLFLPFGVLDRYSQQRPDDAAALHLFALICERLGQRDWAITLMEKVIGILDAAYNKTEDSETERHFALAQVNVGRLRLAQSEYSDATEVLKVALSLLPQGTEDEIVILLRAHASYCLGLACFQLGEYGEALETLEAALEQTPAHLVAVRGQIIQLQSQTLWQLGSDEAREAGKTQLLTAITENFRNMDAITALAAYGMLSLDDDLLNAALSEIRAMPIDEQRKLDPEGTVEHLLTHHHLGQGLVDDAVTLMKASVHAAPMALRPRLRLARLLIQQGHPDQARAVLAGLLHAEGQSDRSHGAEILSLSALALAQSKAEGSKETALKEAQRAVFLDPASLQARSILRFCRLVALQLASSSYYSNPAWIAARLAPTSSTPHCYYLRRGYSASPTPSTSTTPSTPEDNLASPNNASSPRKKIDLHPAPRKPTAAEVATAPLKPPPPAPSPSTTQFGSTLEKANATDATPETDRASAIRLAIEDMQKATQHGILTPPPQDAGTVRRLLHQGIQLFKFYLRGIKLIGVHRKTVLDIRKRLAAEKAEGKEPRLTRWESQFIKTYRQDLRNQLDRIHAKAETTRKDAIKTVSSLLKDVKMEDLKQRVSGGLNSLDGALLKQLCRVFGQGSWGPGLFARRRLERHLDYLKTDDALLAAEGKGIRLSVPELRIALGDRGFVADGLAESALRSKLANWVDATKNKEDAERLQIVLKNLVFGPRENEPQNVVGGGLLEALAGTGFEGLANARRLGEWIEQTVTEENASFLVDFEPPWLGRTPNPVQLELTKTSVEAFWIFTSVPRTTIPKYIRPPKQEDVLLTSLKAPPSPSLEIQPPPLPTWAEAPVDPVPPGETKAPYELPPVNKEPELRWLTAGSKMVEYIKSYPWKNHSLGPMELWPQSLKSSLSAALAAPYPWAVWWGPDLTLLYNDAYAAMCGSKHPGLFAKAGKIGTEAAVAQNLDTQIPITIEDGTIGGFFNTTFESTSKILYERRIQVLRTMGDKTALARSRAEFAEAMKSVLTEDAHKDVPFVAFYFNAIDAPPKSGRDTEHRHPYGGRIRVTSTLAFKIGVPEGHVAIPDRETHFLDPNTFRPVLPFTGRRAGSPCSTIDTRSLPDDSTTMVSNTPGESESASEMEKDITPVDDPSWPFFDVFSAKRPLHITALPSTIVKGFGMRQNGWNDAPREAIIMPIAAEGDEVPIAIMVLGVNTRRPYDKEYQTWIDLVHMTLNSTLTATLGREAELKKAEQLAQLDAAKTSFFSSASHELRTPLTLIAGPVHEALRLTTDPRVKQQLSLTTRNIGRLQKLVDSLMDFTRVEGGRLYGRFRETNLAELTTDLAELFRNPIEKNNIEFIVTSDRSNEAAAYVDHDLWEKIVFNLIGNAFKYTLAGQVHVHTQFRPGWAEFSVSDTGCGIPANEITRVFERFHRSSATARSHEGTGIGLALTRELVKLHGGYITLESTPEDKDNPKSSHGSTFTVHIPLGREHLPAANVEEDSPVLRNGPRAYGRAMIEEAKRWNNIRLPGDERDRTESGGSEINTNSNSNGESVRHAELSAVFRFSPKDTILIVDDNADVRRFLRSIFRPYCNVAEAQNGNEGLVAIEEHSPDLVLSDVMMPGMDGIQFVSTIRERPSISWTPVILLTAKSAEEARVEGL
ncbi:hypothetical protein FRB90_000870, partial [Tulasnella sp. 427]